MNNYLSEFKTIFSPLIEKYDFSLIVLDEESISLKQSDFSIDFIMWREEVGIAYNLFISNNNILRYNITNYMSEKIDSQDRFGVIININSVYERNITELKIIYNALENHFKNILSGDKFWINDYNNSEWFSPPRVFKREI